MQTHSKIISLSGSQDSFQNHVTVKFTRLIPKSCHYQVHKTHSKIMSLSGSQDSFQNHVTIRFTDSFQNSTIVSSMWSFQIIIIITVHKYIHVKVKIPYKLLYKVSQISHVPNLGFKNWDHRQVTEITFETRSHPTAQSHKVD